MAKKAELDDKKVKDNKKTVAKKSNAVKKKNDEKNVVKEVKNEKKKNVSKKNIVKNENIAKETVSKEVSIKDNTKRNKIIKIVIYSLISLIVVGAFIYSIIETSNTVDKFNTITYTEVEDLVNDSELNIIYWASPNCGFCVQFTPIVKKVANANGVAINYLNAAEVSNDEYGQFMSLVSTFNESYATNGLGTPSLVLVKDGKVVDVSVGALSEDGFVSYLKQHEIIK